MFSDQNEIEETYPYAAPKDTTLELPKNDNLARYGSARFSMAFHSYNELVRGRMKGKLCSQDLEVRATAVSKTFAPITHQFFSSS